jgi:hypothetical protein
MINAGSAVNHLTLCLVYITAIYHFDWTTSFLSDVLNIIGFRKRVKRKTRVALQIVVDENICL